MDGAVSGSASWLDDYYKDLSKELVDILSLLLESELTPESSQWESVDKAKLQESARYPAALGEIVFGGNYNGTGLIRFDLRTAVILGCKVSAASESVASEMVKKLDLTGPRLDGFKEICSQASSGVDRTSRKHFSQDIHCKQAGAKVYKSAESVKIPLESEKYVIFPFSLQSPDLKDIKFEFIMPGSILDELVEPDEPDEDEDIGKVCLIFRLSSECDSALQSVLNHNQFRFEVVKSVFELREMVNSNKFSLVVMQIDGMERQGVDLYKSLVSNGKKAAPIWLQGSDWSRDSVLRARGSGADKILVAPLDRNKMEPALQAIFKE